MHSYMHGILSLIAVSEGQEQQAASERRANICLSVKQRSTYNWTMFGAYFEHVWSICEAYVGRSWIIVGSYLDRIWSVVGAYWDHAFSISGAYFEHSWNIFGTCLDRVWSIVEAYLDHVWTMFVPCLGHIGTMFGPCVGSCFCLMIAIIGTLPHVYKYIRMQNLDAPIHRTCIQVSELSFGSSYC
jgi:hypothetical protein